MGEHNQLNNFSTWDLGVRDIFFPNEFTLQLTCGISTKEFPEDEIKLILKKGPMILIDDVFFVMNCLCSPLLGEIIQFELHIVFQSGWQMTHQL